MDSISTRGLQAQEMLGRVYFLDTMMNRSDLDIVGRDCTAQVVN